MMWRRHRWRCTISQVGWATSACPMSPTSDSTWTDRETSWQCSRCQMTRGSKKRLTRIKAMCSQLVKSKKILGTPGREHSSTSTTPILTSQPTTTTARISEKGISSQWRAKGEWPSRRLKRKSLPSCGHLREPRHQIFILIRKFSIRASRTLHLARSRSEPMSTMEKTGEMWTDSKRMLPFTIRKTGHKQDLEVSPPLSTQETHLAVNPRFRFIEN